MALVGGALGLIVAVLFLTLGFWRTVLIVVLVALGAGDRGARGPRTPSWDVVARFFPKDRCEARSV